MLVGGYFGSRVAIVLPSQHPRGLFGLFLIVAGTLLWKRGRLEDGNNADE